jgi:hypothetical protein
MNDTTDETLEENVVPGTQQHINPDGVTDAERGAQLGGVGGALTGIAAGAMVGPAGALLGAVVGGVAGAVASGLAVAAVDTVDDDGPSSDPVLVTDPDLPVIHATEVLVVEDDTRRKE